LNSSLSFGQNAAMNTSRSTIVQLCALLLFASMSIPDNSLGAEGQPGSVKVQGILGQAQLLKVDGGTVPLGPGMVLRAGDVIQSSKGSAVDLHLGETPGTLRLTENTTVVLDKLTAGTAGTAGSFDVELSVRAGEVLGLAKAVPQGSRFEIKVANGIAQILEGRFRIDAQARCVLVEGKVLLAHVPQAGEPSAHALQAPPAVFFAPGLGVQPAPKDLAREIVNQMRSKLPRR